MKIIYHPLALQDIRDSCAYLKRFSERSAKRFKAAVEAVVFKAIDNPFHFHPSQDHSELRRANIRKYNHHLLYAYLEEEDTLYVVVVRHDHRHPNHGLDRLG